MRTKAEIQEHIDEIEADERYNYPPADVFINAPLALIQVGMESAVATLKWVLGEED